MTDSARDWPCLAPHSSGVVLNVKVAPGASKSGLAGLRGDRLRVRIQAPPVEGKANVALGKWIAKTFGLRAREVEILRGEKSSTKSLLLRGAEPAAIAARLAEILGEPSELPRNKTPS